MSIETALSPTVSKSLTWMVAGAGLIGSMAAIALPASTGTAEIAAILAVGALALLAGHQWGLVVVVAADVVLLGKLWPLVVYQWPPAPLTQAAAYAALAGALPGALLLRRALPGTVDLVLGPHSSPRLRRTGTLAGMFLSALWLLLPTL